MGKDKSEVLREDVAEEANLLAKHALPNEV